MKNRIVAVCLMLAFAAVSLVVIPTAASARKWDKANYGFCQSGKKVGNIAKCKENGGTK